MSQEILLLGDPLLRTVCETVDNVFDAEFLKSKAVLQDTLEAFRKKHGFGRGIAAPQIGIFQRFIALNINDRPFVMINPEITWKSEETFEIWDDCMCFPPLLVRVKRHVSVSVKYTDENGQQVEWSNIEKEVAELLQHEIDHLDGILAVDRAVDKDALRLKPPLV